jgi:crotonobetainyl-CoA:carnitine CoA-transferase CaiB-like acyl-CoA transferase
VSSALFESAVFLMGSHMAGLAATGEPPPPMPARRGAWGIYDVFATEGDGQIFIGVTSDAQWRRFCDAFGLARWRKTRASPPTRCAPPRATG